MEKLKRNRTLTRNSGYAEPKEAPYGYGGAGIHGSG